MKIQHAINGGFAEVDDEYGTELIASDFWKEVAAKPTRARRKKADADSTPSERKSS